MSSLDRVPGVPTRVKGLQWNPRRMPPLPQPRQAEGLAGASLLREGDPAQGYLLWRTLRSVLLWAQAPAAQRAELFAEGAYEARVAEVRRLVEAEEEAEASLLQLSELLRDPVGVRAEAVAAHCAHLAGWARERGWSATALEYTQAAAQACPLDGYFSLQAGQAARDAGDHALAEAWLQRAIVVSRRGRGWETYVQAHLAMGETLLHRGRLPAARRQLQRALHRAARHALRAECGRALHDLFLVETRSGDGEQAREYAAQALGYYGAGHPELSPLAFDVARAWMEAGRFASALPVLRALRGRMPRRFQAPLQGSLARAAGIEGAAADYDEALDHLFRLSVEEVPVGAWLDAARGAASLNRTALARSLAERAREAGRGAGEEREAVEALVARLHGRGAPARDDAGPVGAHERALAAELIASLRVTAAG